MQRVVLSAPDDVSPATTAPVGNPDKVDLFALLRGRFGGSPAPATENPRR
jgi:hypothetical protein